MIISSRLVEEEILYQKRLRRRVEESDVTLAVATEVYMLDL
jgi:hypothetical protein